MKAVSLLALVSCFVLLTSSSVLAQERRITKPAAVTAETSDRELDGLNGPVRRVRVEIAKIIVKDGNFTEGPRVLRETSTYDPKGKKIDTVAHPVEGTSLPGKEEYRYDDNGNIVEMILRGEDGSILSKETYTYELDEIGNWKKMTSSVAIYENGKLAYEPVEITYRTISYYFGQAVDKLVAAGKKPDAASVKTGDTKPETPSVKVTETRLPVSEKKPQATETRPPVAETKPQATETSPAKITQAANTSNEQISVPTGSVVSGPTHSTTQPTLKPIESNPDNVVRTETAAAVDSNRQPSKAAHAPAEKTLTNSETAAAANTVSQPIQPPTAEPTAEKTEDKKANAPTDTALARNEVKEPALTEVKETSANARPRESEKTAEVPAENAASRVVETNETPAEKSPSRVVETNAAPAEKTTAPARTIPSPAVAATTPANPAAAAYEQGLNHLAANRFPEAVKSLTESVRLNPNDAQTYLKLGVAYSSQGQYKEAVAVLKMALQIKREVVDAQGFYHLGTAYSNLAKHSDALDAFKQALYIMRADVADTQSTPKNAPPLAHVYHGLGAMYYNLQRPNDAIKELKRAIELNPKLADAYYVLALSYIAVGNRKSAETQRNTLRNLNAKLASQLDKTLSSHDSGLHCRSVFGPCQ